MQEKLKVIEAMDVYLPDVDGVIQCMHNYCLNVCDKTELLAIVPKNKKGYVDREKYQIARCKSFYFPIVGDYYGVPSLDKKFKKKVLETDCDIIHVHSPFGMASFALKIAKKKNVPIVATFHSNMRTIFRSFCPPFIAEMVVRHLGRKYNKFDEVFVCSPVVEQQLRSFGYTGKVSYLPFGTELPRCRTVEENRLKANEEFGIGENELVFIYVGRVMKLKRIDFILDSLKIVKDRGVKFKFFIVGKGAEMKKLKKRTNRLGLSDCVTFLGFIKRELFPLICARGDLLLFPSLYDNFGLVKVESAAFSTAGLFIKDSCAGFGVTDGVNGFLSEDNVEDFADKIIEASSNRQKLKEIGKNASRDLYINWKDCSDALLDRLSQIVKEKKDNQ